MTLLINQRMCGVSRYDTLLDFECYYVCLKISNLDPEEQVS